MRSVRTFTTKGQHSPWRPSSLVSEKLISRDAFEELINCYINSKSGLKIKQKGWMGFIKFKN